MTHTVTEHTLSTGTKGLLIDVPNSEVVNFNFTFNAGYQFTDFAKYDIPHLIEHHILNATERYPGNGEVQREIALNGAYSNAFTGPEFIGYVAECAAFEVERIIDLHIELLTRPLFPEEFYMTERENVRTELKNYLSNYSRQTSRLNGAANFPKEVLRYEDRITRLDSITHKDVVDHYHRTHTARNANFVISGATQANTELILGKLELLYGALPQGERSSLIDEAGTGTKAPLVISNTIDSIHFELEWYVKEGGIGRRAAGGVLASIIGGGWASRLFGRARRDGLTYSLGASSSISPSAQSFEISGFCTADKWERLMSLTNDVLSDLVANGPTQEEVEAAQKRIIGSLTRRYQTAGNMAGWYAGNFMAYGTTKSPEEYMKEISSVTVDMVMAEAKRIFNSDRHSLALVGPVTDAETAAFAKHMAPVWQ